MDIGGSFSASGVDENKTILTKEDYVIDESHPHTFDGNGTRAWAQPCRAVRPCVQRDLLAIGDARAFIIKLGELALWINVLIVYNYIREYLWNL